MVFKDAMGPGSPPRAEERSFNMGAEEIELQKEKWAEEKMTWKNDPERATPSYSF